MFPVLKQVYNDNKAPFGLNMHAAWFFFDDYLKAADTFIKKLLEMDDVYIVSVAQALDWMRYPVEVCSSYGGRGLLGFFFFVHPFRSSSSALRMNEFCITLNTTPAKVSQTDFKRFFLGPLAVLYLKPVSSSYGSIFLFSQCIPLFFTINP